jgi:hypothetical protein
MGLCRRSGGASSDYLEEALKPQERKNTATNFQTNTALYAGNALPNEGGQAS